MTIMNKNVSVLWSADYIGRKLYLLEIDGKLAEVYRSSGLSGTMQEGEFIPFSGLADRQTLSQQLGYIFKEFYYKDRWTKHSKKMHYYPGPQKFCNELSKYLTDIPMNYLEQTPDMDSYRTVVAQTVKDLKEAKKGRTEYFDWFELEE